MRKEVTAQTLDNGSIEPTHVIEKVCHACGFDLDESELSADTCSDCGASLTIRESVAISVTSLPPAFGETS